jgi:tight adherence protein B
MTGRKIRLGPYLLTNALLAVVGTLGISAATPIPGVAALAAGVVLGLGLPWFAVRFFIRRRLNRFVGQFPDAIDLIVRGLRSGLPVSEAIKSVGEEFEDPVGVEFRHIAETVRLGRTLEEGLWEAAKRFNTPEFKFFVVTLAIQRETGGNLGETLDHLSDLLRRRRQMKLKIRALSSEARASAYILGALPFLMFAIIFTLNQGYAMTLFTDPRGTLLIGFGLVMILIGGLIMAKMVRFEI